MARVTIRDIKRYIKTKQMKEIAHTGKVISIEDSFVNVAVEAQSACGSCKAKAICNASESQDKTIAVYCRYADAFQVGDTVEVSIERIMGVRAIFYAYMLPFLVMLAVLLVTTYSGLSQQTAGLSALGSLVIYYPLLRLFKGKLEKEIVFQIRKAE